MYQDSQTSKGFFVYSMTGYATRSFLLSYQDRSTEIIITLKSLNNRFLEVSYKIPSVLQAYEIEISKMLKERVVRGSIQCLISCSNIEFFQDIISPSINTAKAYFSALSQIKEVLHLQSSIELEHLVRMPNLFVISERTLSEAQKVTFFSFIEMIITDLVIRRKEEGESLKRDIASRLLCIKKEMEYIKPLFIARIAEQKKRVQDTLHEIQADESILASSQRTALYTMLDKSDLQEEVTRFESHLENMQVIINSDVIEKGKRLDFTVQEIMRETNTILAKCNDMEISSHGITIKVELEKIREQIQNIL